MTQARYMLGLETSCDETACALVTREGVVVANEIASQVDLHAQFGGVVPEVASRRHLEAMLPLLQTMFERSGATWAEVEAIAVTQGPGLIGCLLMGVETAKALAWVYEKPLVAVHHLQGHLYALQMTPAGAAQGAGAFHLVAEWGRRRSVLPEGARGLFEAQEGEGAAGGAGGGAGGGPEEFGAPAYPHIGLVVSGGHTSLVYVESPRGYEVLAATLDDAVGEAYDKVARLLKLGYPGGPVIDRLAVEGRADRFALTPPMLRRDRPEFSFSGLKAQVARLVEELRAGSKYGNGGGESSGESAGGGGEAGGEGGNGGGEEAWVADLCASFQAAVIESLMTKAMWAAEAHEAKDLLVVGGVACNRGLRAAAEAATAKRAVRVWFPHPSLCTDNAAMIAGLGWHQRALGAEEALALNPDASLPFGAGG